MKPRSAPIGQAASAKPVAAMLAAEGEGTRSRASPFAGLVVCQK